MSKLPQLIGIKSGAVDLDAREVHFELSLEKRAPVMIAGKFGPITQFIGALARMRDELSRHLQAQNTMETVGALEVSKAGAQMDRWQRKVLLQFQTPEGVPYIFALPPQDARDIAEQLKIESAKISTPGNA